MLASPTRIDVRLYPQSGTTALPPRLTVQRQTRRNAIGLFSRDIKSLEDLFNHALKDIYYAEHQILNTLPTLIDNATEPQLKKDLKQHLKETEGQVARLEKVFEMLGQDPKGTRCPAIDGILSEGDFLLGRLKVVA